MKSKILILSALILLFIVFDSLAEEVRVDGKKVETFKRITVDTVRGDPTNGLYIDSDRDGTPEVTFEADGDVLTTGNLTKASSLDIDLVSDGGHLTLDIKNTGTQNAILSVNSTEIVGQDSEVNKSVVEDSGEWDTAYNHSQNNSQAHSDYLINNGSDTTSGSLTIEGGGLTLGKNGVGGVAGTLTLRDGANPGTTSTLTYSKWADLEAVNGPVECNGSGDYSIYSEIDSASGTVTGIVKSDGSNNFSAAGINDNSDVSINSATADNVLKYNGANWVNASSPSASGTVGTTFYMDDTAIIATGNDNDIEVNTLSKFPIATTEDVDTVSVSNNTVIGEAYLYNTALGGVTIDPGEWLFNTYASVDSVIGGRVSSITRNIYHVVVDVSTITTTGSGTSRTATAAAGTPFASGDANAAVASSGYLQTPQGLYQITAYSSTTVVTIATPTTYSNEAGFFR